MSRDTTQHLIDQYQVGKNFDIAKVCTDLALAISEEAKPISAATLVELWEDAMEPGDEKYVTKEDGKILPGLPLLFKNFANFMVAIEQHLGFEGDPEGIMCDDWITDSMPKTRKITGALGELAVTFLGEASAAWREQTGTTPAEVFVQAANTGESYQQTHARLSFAAKGLSEAGQRKDDS